MSLKLITFNEHPENSVSMKCSCLQCDSLSCFAKRNNCDSCSCHNCTHSSTCLYYTDSKRISRNYRKEVTEPYFNVSKKSKATGEIVALTNAEINYDSERKIVLERNQPPPRNLDEYLSRILCANKPSTKLKQTPSSLSAYKNIISDSEEKRKLKTFKGYVKSLKESKLSNPCETSTHSKYVTDSSNPQHLYFKAPEIPQKRTNKCRDRSTTKCLVKTEQRCKNLRSDHNHESARLNSQANAVYSAKYSSSYTCSAAKERNFHKNDILNTLKEFIEDIACSCKPVTPISNNQVTCKCKPCECEQCMGYAAKQSVPKVPQEGCGVYRYKCNPHPKKKREECCCGARESDTDSRNSPGKDSDLSQLVLTRQPLTSITRTCACLPCSCSQCIQIYSTFQTFSHKEYSSIGKSVTSISYPTASLNEVYRREDIKKKNIKHDYVAFCTPRMITNTGYKTRRSNACYCKECECIMCVYKEGVIKSSGFVSTVDRSCSLLKLNTSNKYYNSECEACPQKLRNSSCDWGMPAPCSTRDKFFQLYDGSNNQKSYLNRCRCTNCRCERCIAHSILSNYPSSLGAYSIRKGDVLSPSAHKRKVQKLEAYDKATATALFHKYESLHRDLIYIKPMEDMNYCDISEHMYPTDGTSQIISRRTQRDMGTTLTKSFNRFNILQCDAYVHSQDFNVAQPLLKNNFTSSSYSDLYSITGSSCKDNDKITTNTENETKSSRRSCQRSGHKHCNFRKQLPKLPTENIEHVPKLELLKNLSFDTSTTIQRVENTISDKRKKSQSLLNTLLTVKTSRVSIENVDCSCSHGQALKTEIGEFKSKQSLQQNKNNSQIVKITNINEKNIYEPIKSLSASAVMALQRLFFFNFDHMSNKKNRKPVNNGNSFKCFRVLHNFKGSKLITNSCNNKKISEMKNVNAMISNYLVDIKNINGRARKTLEDAKKFSLDLLNLLKMYEKANNEFVKISEILKTSYTIVVERKLSGNKDENTSKLQKFNVKNNSELNSSFKETTTPKLNTDVISKYESMTLDDIFTNHLNAYITSPQKVGFRPNTEVSISNEEFSNTHFNILERENKPNTKKREQVFRKKEKICYAKVQSSRNNTDRKNKITPEYDRKTIAEITHAVLKQDDFKSLIESDDVFSSTSIDTKQKNILSLIGNEEVETGRSLIYQNSFGITAKPDITNQGAGISNVPSLEIGVQSTIPPISVQYDEAIKNEVYNLQDKVLSQSKLQEGKDLKTPIFAPFSFEEEAEDSIENISVNLDQSFCDHVTKDRSRAKKSRNAQPNYIDKEVWCSDTKLLNELKRQIREQLKKTYTNPNIRKTSSIGSYSCNGECDELKARSLVARKISEHSALLSWSQPQGTGIRGYELLVDGRTVQKIHNPSKCITAVTCLPRTDKIILTIRTITTVMPTVGHYPITTIVYRPHKE